MENLRILSGASDAEIERAAVVTGLAKWLVSLPLKYDTPLPPGGRTLSGGQRQLVVLTAAVASDKPILLLDEALSHMDRLTRAKLLSSSMFHGKTVLSVSHD